MKKELLVMVTFSVFLAILAIGVVCIRLFITGGKR